MSTIRFLAGIWLTCCWCASPCHGEDVLFEDTFDAQLSERWEVTGLTKDDYRIRDGGLEVRVMSGELGNKTPMLKVKLPFKTSDTVSASVEVTVVDAPLERHEFAGLALLDPNGPDFTVRKQNVDGYFLLAPGDVDFIGKSGEEGDPGKYTVKYWPADKAAGPLRIIISQHNAYFQVGPSTEGKYQNFFHSAIEKNSSGMGFALLAAGASANTNRWVRFDNFRAVKN